MQSDSVASSVSGSPQKDADGGDGEDRTLAMNGRSNSEAAQKTLAIEAGEEATAAVEDLPSPTLSEKKVSYRSLLPENVYQITGTSVNAFSFFCWVSLFSLTVIMRVQSMKEAVVGVASANSLTEMSNLILHPSSSNPWCSNYKWDFTAESEEGDIFSYLEHCSVLSKREVIKIAAYTGVVAVFDNFLLRLSRKGENLAFSRTLLCFLLANQLAIVFYSEYYKLTHEGNPMRFQNWKKIGIGVFVPPILTLAARFIFVWRKWQSAERRFNSGWLEKNDRDRKHKILILYANVGSGHKMAAEAIGGALKDLVQEHKEEMTADVEVELIDAMHLCNEVFRTVMQDWFQKLTQSLPGQHMLGYLYDAGDSGVKGRFQRIVENIFLLPLLEKIADHHPHEIVCTHFLPTQLLGDLRSFTALKRIEKVPISCVFTDYEVQRRLLGEN
jgi:hypothetical protein